MPVVEHTCRCWVWLGPCGSSAIHSPSGPPCCPTPGGCRGSLMPRSSGGLLGRIHQQPLPCQRCQPEAHLPRDCQLLGRSWELQRALGNCGSGSPRPLSHCSPVLVFSSFSPAGDNANISQLQLFQGTRRTGALSPHNNENLF